MCFSASASFSASAVILLTGLIAEAESKTRAQHILALIPIFFAVQQFIEGCLWLNLLHDGNVFWRTILTYGFLFFAWLIWPVFIPVSMGLFETRKKWKQMQYVFFITGIVVSAGLIYVMVFHGVQAIVNDYHIDYTFDFHPGYAWVFGGLYLVPTVLSLMLSNIRRMWIFGLLNLISYMYTKIFFLGYVLSIWCFFGALSSTIILWIIIRERRKADLARYSG